MYRVYKQRTVCLIVTLFLVVCYIMFRLLANDVETRNYRKKHHLQEKLYCSVPVTFVIRDMEIFEHDIPNTVARIGQKYRKCDILILPDTVPYPPININSEDVRIVPMEFNLHKRHNQDSVENLIRTEYALFVPDGVRLEPDSVEEILGVANVRDVKMVAVGVDERLGDCVHVNVDLKQWTLTFSPGQMEHECDAFSKDIALLVHRTVLGNLTDPFARPFDTAFYAQTKLRKYKFSRQDDMIINRSKKMYRDIRGQWKRNTLQKARRKAFYEKSGIKKVVGSNGEVEWFGCHKQSERCFATVVEKMPDYLYKGRWTPPCCLKALRETARHVFKVLEEAGVRYWLEGGSLLGAARNKDIIPWDYDVDIGIYREDIVKCDRLKNSELQPLLDDQGFVWEKAKEGDFYRVQFSETNHLHVDIFPFYPKNGIMTKDTWFEEHRQDCEFPEQYLKPMTKIDFADWKASAPNSVREFLEFKFGVGVVENPEYPNPAKMSFDRNDNG